MKRINNAKAKEIAPAIVFHAMIAQMSLVRAGGEHL